MMEMPFRFTSRKPAAVRIWHKDDQPRGPSARTSSPPSIPTMQPPMGFDPCLAARFREGWNARNRVIIAESNHRLAAFGGAQNQILHGSRTVQKRKGGMNMQVRKWHRHQSSPPEKQPMSTRLVIFKGGQAQVMQFAGAFRGLNAPDVTFRLAVQRANPFPKMLDDVSDGSKAAFAMCRKT